MSYVYIYIMNDLLCTCTDKNNPKRDEYIHIGIQILVLP